MKNRYVRWALFLLIGVGIGAAIGILDSQNEMSRGVINASPDDQAAAVIKKPSRKKSDNPALNVDLGGDFTLINQDGETVTQADFADSYKLVFFGFSYCPSICPTELQKITLVLGDLGDEIANKITPIFISVDPERDTPEQLKQYVVQFNPRLVGLTGTPEQIEAVTKSFRIYATKVENDMMDEYMMDHSSFSYLTDHNNKVITLYPSTDTAEEIADDIRARDL
tara:strand:+ start:73 stop:744 length:672 start_codon:yes stop_codon:yes gene_type:complete